MRADKTSSRVGPIPLLDRTKEIKAVVRQLLNEQSNRAESLSHGFAVISANRGAGTTSIVNAISGCLNKSAMEREASRMAADIAETVSGSPIYGERSRMMAAIQEVVTESAICTDPSRLPVTLDYRKLNRPGAEFGTIVAGTLTSEVMHSQTNNGQTVKEVLNGLPIEWDSMSHCRKDCLGIIADLFRLVIIDLPSQEEYSGFQEVTSIVDGVIVVIEENRTTTKDVTRLTEEIEASGGRVMGYVLNKHRHPIPGLLTRCFWKVGEPK